MNNDSTIQSGTFAINLGGQVMAIDHTKPLNDTGTTREVVWKEQIEPHWKRKEREMLERSAYEAQPTAKVNAIQNEIWKQISGQDNRFSIVPKDKVAEIVKGLIRMTEDVIGDRSRVNELGAELFNQVASGDRK